MLLLRGLRTGLQDQSRSRRTKRRRRQRKRPSRLSLKQRWLLRCRSRPSRSPQRKKSKPLPHRRRGRCPAQSLAGGPCLPPISEHFKRYPAEARSRGEQGIAKVAFKMDHEGHLLSSRIVQSSGSTALDQATLAILTRAQPMPRPPDQISDAELSFVVPVRFNFR